MSRGLKEDKLLEMTLWLLSLSAYYLYFFIKLDAWSEFYIFYVFCGFFFYTTLIRVMVKKRNKIDYVLPLIVLYLSTPAGWSLDAFVKIIIQISVETSAELILLLFVFSFCLLMVVLIMTVLLLWLIFYGGIRKKK